VRASVEQLVDPDAFGFSRRNVVVSTVGTSPAAIRRAAALPCKLAWSVHAADDALRKMLVPTTAYPMKELRDELREALAAKPGGDKARVLLVEVALLGGVNDRPMHADQLAALLHPFGRGELIVNLIPYNENGLGIGGVPFRTAQTADVYRFQRKLWDHGLLCTVRAQRGHESSAACGQLATSKVTSMS
jgi:23S rRNA (adenine2503-C2)-methyltransferase